jgi:hypothetical protein
VLWLTTVVALGVKWGIDRQRQTAKHEREMQESKQKLVELLQSNKRHVVHPQTGRIIPY